MVTEPTVEELKERLVADWCLLQDILAYLEQSSSTLSISLTRIRDEQSSISAMAGRPYIRSEMEKKTA